MQCGHELAQIMRLNIAITRSLNRPGFRGGPLV